MRRRKRAKIEQTFVKYADAMDAYVVYFDGCCEPKNPGGTAGYGCVILKGRERVFENSGMIPASPETSNNVAEYLAFNLALDWFIENKMTDAPILVKGDSNLVIQRCFGSWRIKAGFYVDYARAAKAKIKKFRAIRGTWIPRDQNSIADDLSKSHLRQAGIEFRIQPEAA